MADAGDSKSPARKGVWVRLPPPAPLDLRRNASPAGTRSIPGALYGRVGSTPTSGTTTALRRLLAVGVGVVDEFDAFLLQQDADRAEVGQ